MATSEIIFNEYLSAELRKKYTAWAITGMVHCENTGVFKAKGQRPDIVVRDNPAAPICVETEYQPAVTVEQDGLSRLGQTYVPTGGKVGCAMAVRIPDHYKNKNGPEIAAALIDENKLGSGFIN